MLYMLSYIIKAQILVDFRTSLRNTHTNMFDCPTPNFISLFLASTYVYREFVIVLEPYVQPEEDFVMNFMTKPRECYQQAKSDSWRAAHSDGNMLAIIPEVTKHMELSMIECTLKKKKLF